MVPCCDNVTPGSDLASAVNRRECTKRLRLSFCAAARTRWATVSRCLRACGCGPHLLRREGEQGAGDRDGGSGALDARAGAGLQAGQACFTAEGCLAPISMRSYRSLRPLRRLDRSRVPQRRYSPRYPGTRLHDFTQTTRSRRSCTGAAPGLSRPSASCRSARRPGRAGTASRPAPRSPIAGG